MKDATLTPLVPPMLHLCEVGDPSPPSTDAVPDDIDRIPVIYLAGPYSGEDPWEVEQNVRRAEAASAELFRRGVTNICVHAQGRFMDGLLKHGEWLKHDLAILSSSGDDWHARIKRLASRVPELDIFSNGYVLRDAEGWEVTPDGRAFLRALEAVTQDNLPPAPSAGTAVRAAGTLIVVGRRFRNSTRPQRDAEPSTSVRRRPSREPR